MVAIVLNILTIFTITACMGSQVERYECRGGIPSPKCYIPWDSDNAKVHVIITYLVGIILQHELLISYQAKDIIPPEVVESVNEVARLRYLAEAWFHKYEIDAFSRYRLRVGHDPGNLDKITTEGDWNSDVPIVSTSDVELVPQGQGTLLEFVKSINLGTRSDPTNQWSKPLPTSAADDILAKYPEYRGQLIVDDYCQIAHYKNASTTAFNLIYVLMCDTCDCSKCDSGTCSIAYLHKNSRCVRQ